MTEPVYIEQGATFNESKTHRYTLVRRWAPGPMVLWIMLNPSTADDVELDPTLRRCLGFTLLWKTLFDEQYGAFEVCNLYGFRSAYPKDLWRPRKVRVPAPGLSMEEAERLGLFAEIMVDPPADPVGAENDARILDRAKHADLVMVGWGANAKPDRERCIAQILADNSIQPHALRLIKNGSPEHPLYLPGSLVPKPWYAKGLR